MGGVKRLLEEVAADLGTDDISDPAVKAEAQRRLDSMEREVKHGRKVHMERVCRVRAGKHSL